METAAGATDGRRGGGRRAAAAAAAEAGRGRVEADVDADVETDAALDSRDPVGGRGQTFFRSWSGAWHAAELPFRAAAGAR